MTGTNNINNSGKILPPKFNDELKGRADAYEARSAQRSSVSRNMKVANISGNAQETDSLLVPEDSHNIDQNTSKNTSCFSLSSIRNMLSFCYNKVGLTGSYILSCFCSIPENIRNIPTPFSQTKAKDEEGTTAATPKETEVNDASSDRSEDDFVNRHKTRSFTSTVFNEENIKEVSLSKRKSHSVKFGEQLSYIPNDDRSIESDTTPLIKERLSPWQRIGQSLTLNNIKTALSCSWLSRNERESIKAEVNDLDEVFSSSDSDEGDIAGSSIEKAVGKFEKTVVKITKTTSETSSPQSLDALFSSLNADLEKICDWDGTYRKGSHQDYDAKGQKIESVIDILTSTKFTYKIPFEKKGNKILPSTEQDLTSIREGLQTCKKELSNFLNSKNLELTGVGTTHPITSENRGDCVLEFYYERKEDPSRKINKDSTPSTQRSHNTNTLKSEILSQKSMRTLFDNITSDLQKIRTNSSNQTFFYDEHGQKIDTLPKKITDLFDCEPPALLGKIHSNEIPLVMRGVLQASPKLIAEHLDRDHRKIAGTSLEINQGKCFLKFYYDPVQNPHVNRMKNWLDND